MEKQDCALWGFIALCVTTVIVSFIVSTCRISVARANRGIGEVTLTRDEIARPPLDSSR